MCQTEMSHLVPQQLYFPKPHYPSGLRQKRRLTPEEAVRVSINCSMLIVWKGEFDFLSTTSLYRVRAMTAIAATAAPIHNHLLRTLISWTCAAQEDSRAALGTPGPGMSAVSAALRTRPELV